MAYEEIVTSSRKINGKALDADIALTPSDVGAQPTITANGFLKGDGSGNITADNPLFVVNFSGSGNTRASNKTVKQIYDAYTAGYNVVGFSDNNIIQLIQCLQLPSNLYNIVFNGPDYNVDGDITNYPLQILEAVDAPAANTTFDFIQFAAILNTQKINGQVLDGDISLNATDVNAVGLTGDQTIAGNKTFKGHVVFDKHDDPQQLSELDVSIPSYFNNKVYHNGMVYFGTNAIFKGKADFSDSAVTGLKTAAVGTTTDYSIYIGSTAPAANTAPLIWIDTSTSGVMKYRTSTTSTTWTAVPVAWG